MMCVNRMGPGKREERDSENSASDPEWVATMHACEGSVMMNIRAIVKVASSSDAEWDDASYAAAYVAPGCDRNYGESVLVNDDEGVP